MIRSAQARSSPGSVRVIAGRWRGRRLPLPPVDGVRPTGDRVRETLFNWLAPVIRGARCLDLFAGAGALGIEALSRGAAGATLVDADPRVTRHLQRVLERLGADDCDVINADAERYLAGPPAPCDVVFLDPPFGADLGHLCTLLAESWLAPGARVYLESGRDQPIPALPPGWVLLREKTAGRVRFALAGPGGD